MRDIKVTEMPKCDLCKTNDGIYDRPLGGSIASWGNVCEECNKSLPPDSIGSKRIIRIPVPPVASDKVLIGKELTSLEAIVTEEEHREVECPKCGESRTVEPDACYTFVCSGCGRKVRCISIM